MHILQLVQSASEQSRLDSSAKAPDTVTVLSLLTPSREP